MRRNNATPGAREELHFLFEESVSGKERQQKKRGVGVRIGGGGGVSLIGGDR